MNGRIAPVRGGFAEVEIPACGRQASAAEGAASG